MSEPEDRHAPRPAPQGSIAGQAERDSSRERARPKIDKADAFAEKHRAEPFDKSFRTVDYSRLSSDDDRGKRRRSVSSESSYFTSGSHSAEPIDHADAGDPSPGNPGRFAGFAGGTISAGIVRGGAERKAPSMTPHIPGESSDAVVDTASGERPRHDPLNDKHGSQSLHRNFRSMDYSSLDSGPERSSSRSFSQGEGIETLRKHNAATDEAAGRAYVPAFRMSGVAAIVKGAVETTGSPGGSDRDEPVSKSGSHARGSFDPGRSDDPARGE